MEQVTYPFKSCSSFLVAGPSNVGKTYWLKKLITDKAMFETAPVEIMYAYGVYQPMYDEMEKEIDNIQFFHGLPSETQLKEFAKDSQFRLLIIDDLLQSAKNDATVEKTYTAFAHHLKLGVIFVTQNLFSNGRVSRTVSLNANYIILFRNLRDVNQIATLGRQLYTTKSKIFVQAYLDATKQRYGYLVVDIHPHSEDKLRLRTHVFRGEDPIIYSL